MKQSLASMKTKHFHLDSWFLTLGSKSKMI